MDDHCRRCFDMLDTKHPELGFRSHKRVQRVHTLFPLILNTWQRKTSSIWRTSEKTTTLKIGGCEELQVPGRPSAHRARINRRRPADGVINDRRHCLRCTFDYVGRQLWVLPSYAASNVGHSPPFLTCAFQISVPDGRTPPRKLPSRTSDPAPNPNTNLTINLTLSSKLT